jgi:hypothetical protein
LKVEWTEESHENLVRSVGIRADIWNGQFPHTSQQRCRLTHLDGWWSFNSILYFITWLLYSQKVRGLVVRVPGYSSRGPGFDSRCYQIFWDVVGLERGPLSFVR